MATRSINKVILVGNLTRSPEMRYTSTGTPVCTFGIATNREWTDSEGEKHEEAEFTQIVSWGKLAEICYNLLEKGMLVYIEGELRTRSFEDNEGEKQYRTEVHCNDMQLLNDMGKQGVGYSEEEGGVDAYARGEEAMKNKKKDNSDDTSETDDSSDDDKEDEDDALDEELVF
jgi:single-strand DNA-binding protein